MEHKVNHDLERYLRLAAWGLPSKKRLEVRKELRGNIEMLAQEYQIQGHSETQALELALRDFGAPERVCVGMGKVYIMPTIFRNAALMALMATLSISTLNSSTAQVTGTMIWPIKECLNKKSFSAGAHEIACDFSSFWVHLPSLKPTLEPLGVKVTEYISQPISEKTTAIEFPGAPNTILFKHAEEQRVEEINIDNKTYKFHPDIEYISGSDFIQKLTTTLLPVTLRGWNNPEVSVGKTTFRLGTDQQVFKGESIYGSVMWDAILKSFPTQSFEIFFTERITQPISVQPNELYQQQIQIPLGRPDEVYVLISREHRYAWKPDVYQIRRIEPLDQNRTMKFLSRAQNLTFTEKTNLTPVQPNGKGEAILYRFTGRLDKDSLEVVPPEQIKILK
jgi:hypothetical protein